ncbi:putative choline kinase [Cladophialophora carrionii]|uniref:Putative choline kinase n=1 Tax=Cladophialophora carrionii TaxID=86049 RepID=A0A1C1CNU7_9EURO|nr:putative choline kinase [Cladophialophora carrionii]
MQSDISYNTGVTIFDEPEHIPESNAKLLADDKTPELGHSLTSAGSHSPRIHRASISGKKLTGRPAVNQTHSYTSSPGAPLTKAMSYFSLDDDTAARPSSMAGGGSMTPGMTPAESRTPDLRSVLSQVAEWLQEEKSKRHKGGRHRHGHHRDQHLQTPEIQPDETKTYDTAPDQEQDFSLAKLESILHGFTGDASRLLRKTSTAGLRRGSIASKFKQARSVPAGSSDTEFYGEDILVPNVEAKLDNTKTMAFTGGTTDGDATDKAKRKDYDHWVTFKQDILRLTHTLKIKGWRRIPLERAGEVDVARLSGALTNAVYVVHPPKNLPEPDTSKQSDPTSAPAAPISKRRPSPLLLRIYGPQVEHLIDRDAELNILRRLARKRIGPRLLGSFDNGRFEEFLQAKTLTAEDLRVPETSKQIAKRMRELHDGIELLESELASGPATFVNWDKWVDRCEKVITWLDAQIHQAEEELTAGTSRRNSLVNPRYVRRGLICGVEWPIFRRTYDAYRKRLITESGGPEGIRKQLVFAHNDTQYGNLMRLQPSGTSPLLQPSNHHKQLVVIDFEYAAQNLAGLEFANHFTEWCYNYHNTPDKSFVCDTRRYPTEQEQYRFVRSYVMHRPQFNPSASATPKMEAREKTNISDFMLDARTPSGVAGSSTGYVGGAGAVFDYDKEETEREKAQEEEIQRLLQQARVWRLANSAMWVAWGIVQAKVPELDAMEEKEKMAKKVGHAVNEGRKGLADKVSTGEKKVVDKVKKMVADHGYKSGQRPLPMSDPLTQEEKELQLESRWDRPEGSAQEAAHREGDGHAVVEQPDRTGDDGVGTDLEHAISTTDEGDKPDDLSPCQPGAQPGATAADDVSAQACTDSASDTPEQESSEEFDYLAYAQERAMFFWGDCIQMGLIKEEELPRELIEKVKIVPW